MTPKLPVDFDPSPYYNDFRYGGGAYLTKYDSNGLYRGVENMGSDYTNSWDSGWSVAINPSGDALVAGDFVGTVDFGVDSQEIRLSRGDYDAYLLDIPKDYNW